MARSTFGEVTGLSSQAGRVRIPHESLCTTRACRRVGALTCNQGNWVQLPAGPLWQASGLIRLQAKGKGERKNTEVWSLVPTLPCGSPFRALCVLYPNGVASISTGSAGASPWVGESPCPDPERVAQTDAATMTGSGRAQALVGAVAGGLFGMISINARSARLTASESGK